MLHYFDVSDYEKMAAELADCYSKNPSQSLEELAAKQATDRGLIPEQIRHLVQALNNMVFLKLFNRDKAEGKDPTGDFPVAQPDKVVRLVLKSDASCAPPAPPEEESFADMHGDFPDQLRAEDEADGVQVRITIEPQKKTASVKTAATLIQSQRIREHIRSRRLETAFEVLESVEKLAYDLRKTDGPALGRVEMLVSSVGSEDANTAFGMVLNQMGIQREKIATERPQHVINKDEHPLPELVRIGQKLASIRHMDIAETKVQEYVSGLRTA